MQVMELGHWPYLQLSHLRRYSGMAMCSLHETCLTKIACNAIKEAAATEGHKFCSSDSFSLIQVAFPDVMHKLENRDEDEEFPEEEEGEDLSPPEMEFILEANCSH